MRGNRQLDVPDIFQIRVKGLLDCHWSDWFDGFSLTSLPSGETLLSGPIIDQSALFGILNKIRDIGLPLISVNRIDDGD
jgi:hypothetical protein